MTSNGAVKLGDLPRELQDSLAPQVEAARASCSHDWEIDPPKGPKSRGKCRKCGVEAEFDNYLSKDEAEELLARKSRFVRKPKGPISDSQQQESEGGQVSPEEEPMATLTGGAARVRGTQLKPARLEAESLFRKGKSELEVRELLRSKYGEIAASTITGWRLKMGRVDHKAQEGLQESNPSRAESRRTPAPSFAPLPRSIGALVDMLPEIEAARRPAWKKAFDAVFDLVYPGES